MTSIVGIGCADGVVIGADSAASFTPGPGAQPTIEQPTMKLRILHDRVIVAGTGSVGMNQRFTAAIESACQTSYLKNKHPLEVAKEFSKRGIADFAETQAPQRSYAAMVAFPSSGKPTLCEFDIAAFQPELKDENIWYGSLGSAQAITDPFLGFLREVFWNGGRPSLHDAVFCATWALDQAVLLNPGGVNGPIRLAVLEKSGNDWRARLLDDGELEMHRENVSAAKDHLRAYKAQHAPAAAAALPPVPRPSP